MFGKKLKIKVEEDFEEDFERDPDSMTPLTGEKIYWDDYFTSKTFVEKVRTKFSVYKSKIWHSYYDFVEGIKSLWRWKKIIWKDRTWGNHQILDILIFKLKMDAEAMKKREIVEGIDETYEQMMRVATLLEKYNNDEYFTKYREEHDKKWGEDKHYFVELKSGNFEWKSERDDTLSEEDLLKEKDEYNNLREVSRTERENDIKEAFKIMQEKIDEWWD